MATLAQLQTWKSEAEQALHDLNVGARVVRTGYEGKQTEFQQADIPKLEAYITKLTQQIAAATGSETGRRGPLLVEF